MKHIETADFLHALESTRREFQDKYLAMYSSVFGGIVTDPVLMLIPIDDHIVHRGDGIFETFKCLDGSIYNMKAHLDRLQSSARRLSYSMPWSVEEIGRTVVETVRAGARRDCLLRILVSRGPGGFGVNPYECPRAQLHVVATALPQSFMTGHPAGAKAKTSSVPIKPSFFAGIKACNYLPNVLMKKEAVDGGVDFVAGFDERGCLAEGATENFGIVTVDRKLLFPKPDHILPGTTMLRVAELAGQAVRDGVLSGVFFTDIPKAQVVSASEVLILGTTPDVTAVVEFDGRQIGDGRPGPVQKALLALLEKDMRGNLDLLTPAF